jgi:hypothetical protein
MRELYHTKAWRVSPTKFASLYRQEGQSEKTEKCFMWHLELRYEALANNLAGVKVEIILNGVVVHTSEVKALLFLASYHRSHGEYETAGIWGAHLLEIQAPKRTRRQSCLERNLLPVESDWDLRNRPVGKRRDEV